MTGIYEFENIMPLFLDEYAAMLNALKSEKWEIIDLIRQSTMGGCGKHNLITFADYKMVDGVRVSVEPKLVNSDDACSAQSIDYIFLLKPRAHKYLAKPQSTPEYSEEES